MSDTKYSIKLVHLYPDQMNIYGDMGNIITLKQRCNWRNIDFKAIPMSYGEIDPSVQGDIYFMGGGQDNDMYSVFEDMRTYKTGFIRKEVEGNKVFLLVCGGFQLFGEKFIDGAGREIKGLEILPVSTRAPGLDLKQRCLGNIVTELSQEIREQINLYYEGDFSKYLVGFENHSGQTYFEPNVVNPIGNTILGLGNNVEEKKEGAKYKNVFGSYTHGSLLPKNPHFTDLLIGLALEKKYGKRVQLSKLDDSAEWQAHKRFIEMYAPSSLT